MDNVELLFYRESVEVERSGTIVTLGCLLERFGQLVVVEELGAFLFLGIHEDVDAPVGSVAHIPEVVGSTNPAGLYIVVIHFA